MQRSSMPAGPNTSCIEVLPGAATWSSDFFCGGTEGRDCWTESLRRAKADGGLLSARSCSDTCVRGPGSPVGLALLSVVARILRAKRVKVSCRNLEFIIEMTSYLNIPPSSRTVMLGGRQNLGFRASALILEHHASFCGDIAAKAALQSMAVPVQTN